MSGEKMQRKFKGKKYTVIHCDGAIESFEAALAHMPRNKARSFRRGMSQQIQRLADGHRMSKESFPQEGDLPKKPGQNKTKKFYALKRIPIRGYCWYSEKHGDTYFISHYVFKDYQKLKKSDTDVVGDNWLRIEVNNHEF